MGLFCKCPTSFLNDQTREFPIIILGISTVSKADEPTNHLDLPSRLVLEAELDSFRGALLLVSHDHFFLNKVCTQWWGISCREKSQDSELIVH